MLFSIFELSIFYHACPHPKRLARHTKDAIAEGMRIAGSLINSQLSTLNRTQHHRTFRGSRLGSCGLELYCSTGLRFFLFATAEAAGWIFALLFRRITCVAYGVQQMRALCEHEYVPRPLSVAGMSSLQQYSYSFWFILLLLCMCFLFWELEVRSCDTWSA